MSMEEKNIFVAKYLGQIAKQINNNYPNLMDNDKLKKAKEMFLNRTENYEQIIDEINKLVQDMIEKENKKIEMRKKLADEIKKKQTENLNQDKFFGESYKASLIEIFKLYENIDKQNIDDNKKQEIFDKQLKDFITSSKMETTEFLKHPTNNPELLKNGLNALYIGYDSLNYNSVGKLRNIFINDFDVIQGTAEGKMKMTVPINQKIFDDNGKINPELNFDFSRIKVIYDYARDNGKQIKHHELLWHDSVPENLREELSKITNPILKRNMTLNFLDYYYGKLANFFEDNKYDVRQIDALNEIANDNLLSKDTYRQSFWNDMIGDNPLNGDKYFIDVLRIARKHFPKTELIYNDYNEFYEGKCDRMCEIVNYIKSRERNGEKLIDGLGLQAHYTDFLPEFNRMLTPEDIEKTALKFSQLGVPIYITEFDFNKIKGSDISKLLETFTRTYGNIAIGLNSWGNSDALTWHHCLGPDGKPLNSHIIDENGNKKEIFNILKNKFLNSQDREYPQKLTTQKQVENLNQKTIQPKIQNLINPSAKIPESQKIIKKKAFDQRSQSEIQIASQIRQKNKMIVKQQEKSKQITKPKTLVRTKQSNNNQSNNNKGYIDIIILSIVVSFIAGAVSMFTYYLISR